MNKKLFLAIAMVLLALLLVAGCGGGGTQPQEPEQPPADSQAAEQQEQEPEPQQEADAGGEMVFVSSADKASCTDCHQKVSDEKDYSLTASLAKLEGHPQVPVEGVADCLPCHAADGDNSLRKVLHVAHYSGDENHFVSNYEGSCVHCHKPAEDGAIPVAGLEAADTTFVTIEVASVDKSPGGCLDCHKKVSDDKDYSLTASIAKLEGHPQIPMETAADCIQCHAEGTPLALSGLMHTVHLQGEHYRNYGNSCINCHDQQNKMAVKGL